MMEVRYEGFGRLNFGVTFVPEQEVWVVERLGKFHRTLQAGLNFLIPFVDDVKFVYSMKEIAIEIPQQSAITQDYATLRWDAVIFLRVRDAFQASYGVGDPKTAIFLLVHAKMRSEIGKVSLERILGEKESINAAIVECVNKAALSWGITCLRFEIRDIKLPVRVQGAMQEQLVAERRKKAAILKSEGVRAAEINLAEGKHQARVLASEAEKQEQINRATAEAAAYLIVTEAKAKGLKVLADSLTTEGGNRAAAMTIAGDYIEAVKFLAKTSSTINLSSNGVDQVLSLYKNMSSPIKPPTAAITSGEPDTNLTEYFTDGDGNCSDY